jgi:hypothetical protein
VTTGPLWEATGNVLEVEELVWLIQILFFSLSRWQKFPIFWNVELRICKIGALFISSNIDLNSPHKATPCSKSFISSWNMITAFFATELLWPWAFLATWPRHWSSQWRRTMGVRTRLQTPYLYFVLTNTER